MTTERDAAIEAACKAFWGEKWRDDPGWFPGASREEYLAKMNAAILAYDQHRSKQEPVGWDHRYRRLDKGEIILASDECQQDDGSWRQDAGRCAGTEAPDPAYTSHRVYRRASPQPADVGALRARIDSLHRAILAIEDWDDLSILQRMSRAALSSSGGAGQ